MALGSTRYRELVERGGLSGTHRQLIAWVPAGSRVLELGCSTGYIGRRLIQEKGCSVTGVELDSAAADEARQAGLSVIEGSLDDPSLRGSIEDRFDVVIAADVLEHLRDPAAALTDIRRWVAPNGCAVLAVPNIATWSVRAKLFFGGHFEYEETGIMDRTHVHFFTYRNFHALLRGQGWRVRETMVEGWEVPGLTTLLFHWPRAARARVGAPRDARGLGKVWRAIVYALSELALSSGELLSHPLVRFVPNLCAPHVAVLVSPGA
jgi:methionine biosynthesis protein MetW